MKDVLIGSKAIKFWFDDFPREPNDTDYAVDVEQPRDGSIEYLFNPVFVKHVNDGITITGDLKVKALIPKIDDLLTLKASHLFWNIKWEKHLFDACFLSQRGAKINKELFFDLVKFWESYHGKRYNSDLTLDPEKFFDNAINGENGLDHDYIHTLINKNPVYEKVLKGKETVEPCAEKFEALSYDEKKLFVEEEVMVMAFERFRKIGYRHAFTKMLKKFIMNHAPIWSVPFIIQNYIDLEKPSFNYYKRIENVENN